MASIFDTLISVYRDSHDNVGMVCKLSSFLHSERHRISVEHVREETNHKRQSELKRQLLPAATISGVFKPRRGAEFMVQHSGFMCVDIDWKDNKKTLSPEAPPNLPQGEGLEVTGTSGANADAVANSSLFTLHSSLEDTLQMLRQLPWNAYMARSCGGKGYFILVPLAHPERHLEHFLALEREFKTMGIVIDRSCKDVCRLRYVSWDDEPYVNEGAVKYEGLVEVEDDAKGSVKRKERGRGSCDVSHDGEGYGAGGADAVVERLVVMLERCQIDITDSYDDWYKIGFALASLGEGGRGFYHRVSRISRKYNHAECNKKFDNLLKHRSGRISIGTFISVCADYGIKSPTQPPPRGGDCR